jgi:hypothetical protein
MEGQLVIQAQQRAVWEKMNRKMDNMDGRMVHVETSLADVKEQLEVCTITPSICLMKRRKLNAAL